MDPSLPADLHNLLLEVLSSLPFFSSIFIPNKLYAEGISHSVVVMISQIASVITDLQFDPEKEDFTHRFGCGFQRASRDAAYPDF